MAEELFSKKGIKKAIKESREILNLVPKMYIKPGEAFSKIIEIAKLQRLINFLIIYYICFTPFVFLFVVSIFFKQFGASLLTVIFIPFLLIAMVVFCAQIGIYALIASYIFSVIYYFLGKLFKAEGEFNHVLSTMVLFIAAGGLITIPEGFILWGYKQICGKGSPEVLAVTIIYILTIMSLSIIYLPMAFSKSLKITLFRAFILTILPYLIFFIGSFLVFILI